MKSKHNPLIFRSLATGAALFAIAPLHAAEIDTTSTTVTLSPGNKYIGTGILQVSGGGAVWLSSSGDNTEFAMTDGVIDIVSGTTLVNGGWARGKWAGNKADLHVNGTLDMYNGDWIDADALTGSGAVTMPDVDGWYTGGLVLGGNGGGGTFTGTISDPNNGTDNIQLHKYGTGTQILTGANTYSSSTIIGGGTLQIGNGGATGSLSSSSAISVYSGATFVINQSDTVTQGTDFSSAGISGAGGFTQAGAGTTVLNAGNTYTGATTVNGGTLSLGNGGTTGSLSSSSAISVGSGATFVINQSDTVTQGTDFSSAGISGAGGFTQAGAGTTVLNATNTYTGGTTVTGGTLTLGAGGSAGVIRNSLTINSGATVSAGAEGWSLGYANGTSVTDITLNGGTLNFTGGSNLGGTSANAITFSTSAGTISGTDFDWYNANTTTPTLTVAAAASGSVISSGINLRLTSSGNLTMDVADGANSNDMLVSGVIRDGSSDTGASIIKTGAGTLTLSGANSYSGGTTISQGTLKLQGAAFSTTARAYSIASGAVLNLDGGVEVASGNTTISGTGTLRISGGGLVSGADGRDLTLELGSGALIDIQSGASMYNGGWQNMIWTNNLAGLQLNGTLEMGDGNNIFVDALTGSGTVAVSGSGYYTLNQSITVGVHGGGGTFSGNILDSNSDDDTVSLIKTGGGTQILTGTNTYIGTTTVSNGKLIVNGNNSAATGAVTVASGATLGGIGTVGGATTISGTHTPGNSPGVQSFSSDLTYASTSIFEWDLASSATGTRGTDYDGVNVGGTLSGVSGAIFKVVLGAGAFTDTFWNTTQTWTDIFKGGVDGSGSALDIASVFSNITWYQGVTNMTGLTGAEGSFTISGSSLTWTAVPEPTSALAGLLITAGLLRRRRKF